MLDTPKKRVLFIFFIGTSLSIYSEVDLFWVKETFIWSLIIILGQSTNWLLTGFVLNQDLVSAETSRRFLKIKTYTNPILRSLL